MKRLPNNCKFWFRVLKDGDKYGTARKFVEFSISPKGSIYREQKARKVSRGLCCSGEWTEKIERYRADQMGQYMRHIEEHPPYYLKSKRLTNAIISKIGEKQPIKEPTIRDVAYDNAIDYLDKHRDRIFLSEFEDTDIYVEPDGKVWDYQDQKRSWLDTDTPRVAHIEGKSYLLENPDYDASGDEGEDNPQYLEWSDLEDDPIYDVKIDIDSIFFGYFDDEI